MKIRLNKANAATAVVAFAMLIGISACKGRTMNNMEPTGETVEVIVNAEDEDQTANDTVIETMVSVRDTIL